MEKFEVVFRPRAKADLRKIYLHIAEQAGPAIAGAYIERIERTCLTLEIFPHRGTRRDDIRIGLRAMGFERRATIVFRVFKTEVVIVRVFYGGQDFQQRLLNSAEE